MKFGLIGKKLAHSFSRNFFTKKFQQEKRNAEYLNFELEEIENFPALLDAYPDLVGLNVTIPYKTSIMPLLDTLSPAAEAIGAVNTIRIEKGETIGYNTDVVGFHSSLGSWLEGGLTGPALILGTGGAAKAVHFVLSELLKWDEVWFCSRSPMGEGGVTYNQLSEIGLDQFKLIVNATPLGMFPEVKTFPPIPYDQLKGSHHLYDLVYNPEEPLFLQKGKAMGAKTLNGLPMLIGQAEAAWDIWIQ